jgi:hypothetical protein
VREGTWDEKGESEKDPSQEQTSREKGGVHPMKRHHSEITPSLSSAIYYIATVSTSIRVSLHILSNKRSKGQHTLKVFYCQCNQPMPQIIRGDGELRRVVGLFRAYFTVTKTKTETAY